MAKAGTQVRDAETITKGLQRQAERKLASMLDGTLLQAKSLLVTWMRLQAANPSLAAAMFEQIEAEVATLPARPESRDGDADIVTAQRWQALADGIGPADEVMEARERIASALHGPFWKLPNLLMLEMILPQIERDPKTDLAFCEGFGHAG